MTTLANTLCRRYSAITDFLCEKAFYLAMVCLGLMVIPITVDVVIRSVSVYSISGTVEVEELLMFTLVFMGLAYPQLSCDHIDMNVLFPHLPAFMQRFLYVFHWTLSIILMVLVTREVGIVAVERFTLKEYTEAFAIPTYPFYFLATIGLGLLVLALFKCLGKAVASCWSSRSFISLCLGLCLPALVWSLPWLLEETCIANGFMLTGSLAFVLLIVLLLLRMPIGYAMMLVGILGVMCVEPDHLAALQTLGIVAPNTALSYTLTVVPLFILMGELAMYSNISGEVFDAANKWLGRLPGGLSIASEAGCAGFAAICGDSFATAMTMSSVALPEMKKRHYNNGLACAALASGGTLGILIPPSVGFIFYAIITEESLGRLFIAGVVPGIILALFFCTVIYVLARLRPELAPIGQRYTLSEKLRSLKGLLPMMGLIFFVLGGMLTGYFSPSEAGAVGAAGTFVFAVTTRRLSWENFKKALGSSVLMTAKLMMIMIGVNVFGYLMAATQLPMELANWIQGVTSNKYLVFSLVVLLYIALGCMVNVIPMILLTLPAIYPTIQTLGFDPIWFGVVTVILMEMGQITPPMGLVVFAISGTPDGAPMGEIFKYIIYFVGSMLALVFLLTLFPQIALFLPNLLM